MRLSEKQYQNIRDTFKEVFQAFDAELWLFGSRVDDTKRGGDIDLLIKCDEQYEKLMAYKEKYHFLLEKKLGLRKIDIVLENDNRSRLSPVVISAKKNGILLATTLSTKGDALC